MAPLYIFDLEGTTGIYSQGAEPHVNNVFLLRPCFRQVVQQLKETGTSCAIASRAPHHYGQEILKNLAIRGIQWPGKTYFEKDIDAGTHTNRRMLSYKNFSAIYRDFGITSPEKDAVVVGDFLRFGKNRSYTQDEYCSFNFHAEPLVLISNYALNDHPFPHQEEVPLYAVVPQPWTTGGKSLDFQYVFQRLQDTYSTGKGNFTQGFRNMKEREKTRAASSPDQFVESDDLARRTFSSPVIQRYMILKGESAHWKPLEELL